MTQGYSLALRKAKGDANTSAVGNAGIIKLYDGTRPATGGAVTTELAAGTLGTPFAPAATGTLGGTVSLTPTVPSGFTGSAAGTATWYRITTSGGTFVEDGTVGMAGSGANMILATTTISIGLTISISSWTIGIGNP